MSPAFLAALTLGALVAWLALRKPVRWLVATRTYASPRLAAMAVEVKSVPFRFEYAARVAREAFEEQDNIEVPLALAA